MTEPRQEKSYDYFVHISMLTGYSAILPVTRLPRVGESVEDWLLEECDVTRGLDVDAGILYLRDLSEMAIVSFHRQPIEPEPPHGYSEFQRDDKVIRVVPPALPEEEFPEED